MTGDPGPDEKKPDAGSPATPEPDKLEKAPLDKPADGPDGAAADGEESAAASRLAKLPGRTLLTVAAAIIAVSAIALTTFALASHGGGDQKADPNDLNTGPVTFGPNQPDETDLGTGFPTFPSSPTFPTAPTTGLSLPTASTSSYPTSFPSYTTSTRGYTPYSPYSSYTYTPYTPTYTTSSVPTTPTTTTTGPVKTTVYPQAPIATPITKCGTYGKLQFARTTGVRYSLAVGDGKQGRWVVKATARKGYVIADGATRKFKGNLHNFRRCRELGIREVTATPGPLATDPWMLDVRTSRPNTEHRTISLAITFGPEVSLAAAPGGSWSCSPTDEATREMTCTYGGDAKQPQVSLTLQTNEGAALSGWVTMRAGSDEVETATFG